MAPPNGMDGDAIGSQVTCTILETNHPYIVPLVRIGISSKQNSAASSPASRSSRRMHSHTRQLSLPHTEAEA